jgi:hypothetical protein
VASVAPVVQRASRRGSPAPFRPTLRPGRVGPSHGVDVRSQRCSRQRRKTEIELSAQESFPTRPEGDGSGDGVLRPPHRHSSGQTGGGCRCQRRSPLFLRGSRRHSVPGAAPRYIGVRTFRKEESWRGEAERPSWRNPPQGGKQHGRTGRTCHRFPARRCSSDGPMVFRDTVRPSVFVQRTRNPKPGNGSSASEQHSKIPFV